MFQYFGVSAIVCLRMSPEILVTYAEKIATEAHTGQFRKGGKVPYIMHPKDVAERVRSHDLDAQVVAWLHDVIEDTDETEDSLREAGIPRELVDAIVLLTRTREMSYDDYIDRVSSSPLARQVKIADLISNLADRPSKKQIRKYAGALVRLTRD